jgi:hypothetical protein
MIVTLGTIGYGDNYPLTPFGKLVMAMVMYVPETPFSLPHPNKTFLHFNFSIVSIFVMAYPLSMITIQYTHIVRIMSERKRKRKEITRRIVEATRLKALHEQQKAEMLRIENKLNQNMLQSVGGDTGFEADGEEEMDLMVEGGVVQYESVLKNEDFENGGDAGGADAKEEINADGGQQENGVSGFVKSLKRSIKSGVSQNTTSQQAATSTTASVSEENGKLNRHKRSYSLSSLTPSKRGSDCEDEKPADVKSSRDQSMEYKNSFSLTLDSRRSLYRTFSFGGGQQPISFTEIDSADEVQRSLGRSIDVPPVSITSLVWPNEAPPTTPVTTVLAAAVNKDKSLLEISTLNAALSTRTPINTPSTPLQKSETMPSSRTVPAIISHGPVNTIPLSRVQTIASMPNVANSVIPGGPLPVHPMSRRQTFSIRDVQDGVTSKLVSADGVPHVVQLTVQDWRLSYDVDAREDVLNMRIKVKDELVYRRLMKVLAEFS